jgi:putative redox protein
MTSREVVVTSTSQPFEQTVTAGPHQLVADEPADRGGGEAGPNPYDLLLASLGACTSMTLELYARRKQWPLLQVIVRLTHTRVHVEDCIHCEDPGGWMEIIDRRITLIGDALTDEQRARLLEIAGRCPVHKTLSQRIDIRTRLVEPKEEP